MVKEDWKKLFLREKLVIIVAGLAVICEVIFELVVNRVNNNNLLIFMATVNSILQVVTLILLLYNLYKLIVDN